MIIVLLQLSQCSFRCYEYVTEWFLVRIWSWYSFDVVLVCFWEPKWFSRPNSKHERTGTYVILRVVLFGVLYELRTSYVRFALRRSLYSLRSAVLELQIRNLRASFEFRKCLIGSQFALQYSSYCSTECCSYLRLQYWYFNDEPAAETCQNTELLYPVKF